MDYKSSFKSHQQFKTNTIYIKILQLNRKLDGGEGISGIEASNTMVYINSCKKIASIKLYYYYYYKTR